MLFDKLKDYSQSGVYPFHMPGHKRRDVTGNGVLPYAIDLTEIKDFDYLHNPRGCIREIEHEAEQLFNAERAFMLVNGATGGILAAVSALTKPNDTVIMARNCHRSVYNAVQLCALEPMYCLPKPVSSKREYSGIYGSVSPSEVERLLSGNPGTRLVIVTSPTYDGVSSDIRSIAEICHRHGALLFVDEAHGAHFAFDKRFPSTALKQGADASVVSLHKTLPSLTQTALLLTNSRDLKNKLQGALAVFETSSPSYVLMSSMEVCFNYLNNNTFSEYISNIDSFREKCKELKKLKLLFSDTDSQGNAFDYDIGKLVISTSATSLTGNALAEMLRERGIETEMSAADYVIAMTSVCDTAEGFDRLYKALKQIDRLADYSDKELTNAVPKLPEKVFKPYDIYKYETAIVDLSEASGKIAAEYVFAYPPGIPLAVPGERISRELTASVHDMRQNGVEVVSSGNNMPTGIAVAKL